MLNRTFVIVLFTVLTQTAFAAQIPNNSCGMKITQAARAAMKINPTELAQHEMTVFSDSKNPDLQVVHVQETSGEFSYTELDAYTSGISFTGDCPLSRS